MVAYHDDDKTRPCLVCLRDSIGPIQLRCGHTFCFKCLSRCADHSHSRCPTCRREHLLDPAELRARLEKFRSGYSSWRRGGAKGARGEVCAISEIVSSSPTAAVSSSSGLAAFSLATSPRNAELADKLAESTPRSTKLVKSQSEPPSVVVGAQKTVATAVAEAVCVESVAVVAFTQAAAAPTPVASPVRPSAVWLSRVVLAAPETLPTVALFVHALCSAFVRDAVRGIDFRRRSYLPIGFFVCLSCALCSPRLKQKFVNGVVPKATLQRAVGLMFAFEFAGLALLGCAGADWGKTGAQPESIQVSAARACVAFLGAGVTTQFGLIGAVQRKTTGTRAIDSTHAALATVATIAHHLASFVYLPDSTTAAFVVAWRCLSITVHCYEWLDATFSPPEWCFIWYGWLRYALCVGFFQPTAFLAVLAHVAGASIPVDADSSSTLARLVGYLAILGKGLCANATGHAAYALFRAMRLSANKFSRDRGLDHRPLHASGRQYPALEIETASLTLLGLAALLALTTVGQC